MKKLLEKMIEWNPIITGIIVGFLIMGIPLLFWILAQN